MTFLHRLAQRIARFKTPTIALAAIALGCSQGERTDFLSPVPANTTPQLQSIQISPRIAVVQAEIEFRFTATTLNTSGATMSAPVDWTAESGTISSEGRFVGVVPGPVRVTVRSHDRPELSDVAVIAVWQNETDPTGISVQPAEITLEEGDSLTFTAFLNLANGVQAAGATVDWSATGGQINSSGYFVAATAGDYLVKAQTSNGYSGSARVRVTKRTSEVASVTISPKTARLAPSQGTQFTANTYFTDGKTIPATYLWSTNGGSVTQTGTYLAPSVEGTYRVIVVGVANLADTAIVTVVQQAPTLASLRISPNPVSIQASGAQQFSVAGTMSDGSAGQPAVTWSSTGGSISASGRYNAGSVPGTYRVVARQQGGSLADTSVVTIQPPAVVALAVSPRSTSLQPGTSQQFTASATWSNGSTTLPPLTWAATGGSVSSNGSFTAGTSGGTYQVSVAGGGLTDQATVNVGAPVVLVSLSVSPKPAQLATGGTLQFSAEALWSDGTNALPAISWSATGGTISSNGLYSAGSSTGAYHVIANGGSRADTVAVTLTAQPSSPTLTGITIAPKNVSLSASATQQFSATGVWAGGTGTMPAITWSATGGAINASGFYAAGAIPGSYRVIVTGGGKADTAAVTVNSTGSSVYVVPESIDHTGVDDVTDQLTAFFASVPDGSVIAFQAGGRYRVEGTLWLADRHRITIDGNGATIIAETDGSGVTPPDALKHGWPRQRQHLLFTGGEDIAVRNLTIHGANPHAGLGDSAYVASLEAQHGLAFLGVRGVRITGVDVSDVYGDFVYLGINGTGAGEWTHDVHLSDFRFERSGRQGVSVTGADSVVIEDGYIGDVRRSAIDLEPNTAAGGATHITFRRVTFGRHRLNWLASGGAGPSVGNVVFEDNRLVGAQFKVFVGASDGARRGPFRFVGNVGDTGDGNPQGVIMQFHWVDGLTVLDNYTPLQRLRNMALVGAWQSCGLDVRGNSGPEMVQELRIFEPCPVEQDQP